MHETRAAPPIRRIALVCSGLAEGRNGVGDYCRRLAHTLAGQGLACDLLALNDPAAIETTETTADDGATRMARLPAAWTDGQKARAAGAILRRWKPDAVSLHFVCYGFDPRGLAWREAHWLPPLLKGFPLEIMMHELWIGHRPGDPWRDKLIGAVQRLMIRRLLRRLQPNIVHTNNAFFKRLLSGIGVPATVLPLFGNIPVRDDKAPWLVPILSAACGIDIDRERTWIFGLFGGIWSGWDPTALFDRISAIAERTNRQVIVASIGRAGAHAPDTIDRWRSRHPRLHFALLGPRSEHEVSQFLNSIDFGLTTYPINLLGKSGAASAMFEHGVCVIATWGDIAPDLPPVWPAFADLVWRNDDALERRLLAGRPDVARTPLMVDAVAKQFLQELAHAMTRAAVIR